jgi:hypothetical protein
MTVLKSADDKQPQLDALAALLERPDVDAHTRKRIQEEIWAVRAVSRASATPPTRSTSTTASARATP